MIDEKKVSWAVGENIQARITEGHFLYDPNFKRLLKALDPDIVNVLEGTYEENSSKEWHPIDCMGRIAMSLNLYQALALKAVLDVEIEDIKWKIEQGILSGEMDKDTPLSEFINLSDYSKMKR